MLYFGQACAVAFNQVCVAAFSQVCIATFSQVCIAPFSQVCIAPFCQVCIATFSQVCIATFSQVCIATFSQVCIATFSQVCVSACICFFLWQPNALANVSAATYRLRCCHLPFALPPLPSASIATCRRARIAPFLKQNKPHPRVSWKI